MEFNFNNNLIVDAIESVPEDFRGLYVETDDGKFKLNTEDGVTKSAVAAITRLNKALVASRGEVKAVKGKVVDLSSLSEYGDSPSSILEGINASLEEVRKASKGKGGEELERLVSKAKLELGKAHEAAMSIVTKENESLTGQLHGHLVTSAATSALIKAGANDPDLLMPFMTGQVKVQKSEDGNLSVAVVDGSGDIRYSGTTALPMGLEELAAEMKGTDKYKSLFKSEVPQGGGKIPGRPGFAPPKGKELSATEKISLGLTKGQYTQGRPGA